MAVQSQTEKAINESVRNQVFFNHKLMKSKLNTALGILLLYVCDITTLVFSIVLAFATRKLALPYLLPSLFSQDIAIDFATIYFPILLLILLSYDGLYHKRYPYWQEVKLIVKGNMWSLGIAIALVGLS